MNRFAKMKKERIYTLFETLSKNTDFPVDPGTGGSEGSSGKVDKMKKRFKRTSFVGAEGFEPPTLWV